MPTHRLPPLLAALCVSTALLACTPAATVDPARAQGEGQVIDAEAIHASGLPNAWEVVRRYGTHLKLTDDRTGRPSTVSRRGRESILLREDPLLIVDGAVTDLRILYYLPTRDLHRIRILTGTQGTARYGMTAASGAIVVETRRSDSQ